MKPNKKNGTHNPHLLLLLFDFEFFLLFLSLIPFSLARLTRLFAQLPLLLRPTPYSQKKLLKYCWAEGGTEKRKQMCAFNNIWPFRPAPPRFWADSLCACLCVFVCRHEYVRVCGRFMCFRSPFRPAPPRLCADSLCMCVRERVCACVRAGVCVCVCVCTHFARRIRS